MMSCRMGWLIEITCWGWAYTWWLLIVTRCCCWCWGSGFPWITIWLCILCRCILRGTCWLIWCIWCIWLIWLPWYCPWWTTCCLLICWVYDCPANCPALGIFIVICPLYCEPSIDCSLCRSSIKLPLVTSLSPSPSPSPDYEYDP